MRKILIIFASLSLFVVPISIGIAGDTPRDVVEQFCQLDFEGARLSSDYYESIQPLVSYQEEPGWDIAIGIRSYKILSEIINGNRAEVRVKYDIDQSWPSGVTVDNVEVIKLGQVSGDWKIDKYVEYPRVSTEVLCKQFNKCKMKG